MTWQKVYAKNDPKIFLKNQKRPKTIQNRLKNDEKTMKKNDFLERF